MKIESQIEKISSFQHLELLANQVVEVLFRVCIKVRSWLFGRVCRAQSLQCRRKYQAYWLEIICQDRSFVRQTIRGRKPTCAAILLSIIRHRCIILNWKRTSSFLRIKLVFHGLSSFNEFVEETADAIGLSVFRYLWVLCAWKGSDRHHRMILNALEGLLTKPVAKSTDTVTFCIKLLKNSPTFHDYLVYRYVSV
jgi:hypothetical protein